MVASFCTTMQVFKRPNWQVLCGQHHFQAEGFQLCQYLPAWQLLQPPDEEMQPTANYSAQRTGQAHYVPSQWCVSPEHEPTWSTCWQRCQPGRRQWRWSRSDVRSLWWCSPSRTVWSLDWHLVVVSPLPCLFQAGVAVWLNWVSSGWEKLAQWLPKGLWLLLAWQLWCPRHAGLPELALQLVWPSLKPPLKLGQSARCWTGWQPVSLARSAVLGIFGSWTSLPLGHPGYWHPALAVIYADEHW